MWPYRVIKFNPHTLVICEGGIQNLVSIDRVTLAQSSPVDSSAPSSYQQVSTRANGELYNNDNPKAVTEQ